MLDTNINQGIPSGAMSSWSNATLFESCYHCSTYLLKYMINSKLISEIAFSILSNVNLRQNQNLNFYAYILSIKFGARYDVFTWNQPFKENRQIHMHERGNPKSSKSCEFQCFYKIRSKCLIAGSISYLIENQKKKNLHKRKITQNHAKISDSIVQQASNILTVL